MATLGFRRERGRRTRREPDVELTVSADDDESQAEPPVVPWALAAGGGGLLAALAGWLLVSLVLVLGWTATPDLEFTGVMSASTRLWLLSHFADVTVGGLTLGIAPLGLSLIHALIVSGVAGFAAQMARRMAPEALSQHERRSIALRVVGVFTAAYAIAVLVASFTTVDAQQSARALVGALVIGGGSSLVGAVRATEWRPLGELPLWAQALPRAVGAALLVMVVTGAAVMAVAMLRERDRMMMLHDALQPGTLGGILLVVLQLLWLPNLVIWAASWSTGAGFTLGLGSIVSPATNEFGLLPALPVLGALPGAGVGPSTAFLWLTGPVLAGATAAWVVLRARPRARFDETALVGGLAGVLAGLALTLLAVVSGGDLGAVRLVELGPRATALAVMAPTLMGFAGALTGAVAGLVRRPARDVDDPDGDAAGVVEIDDAALDERDSDAGEPTARVNP